MRHILKTANTLWRRPGLVAVFVSLCAIQTILAQPPGSDPVEELQQALRISIRTEAKVENELALRKKTLGEKASKLKQISQLHRALALLGWEDNNRDIALATVDSEVRKQVENRLVQELGEKLRHEDAASRLAAVSLIGEIGNTLRATGTRSVLGHTFSPDLLQALSDKNLAVRAAAARAIASTNPDASKAVPALANLLESDNIIERRAAAAGLAGMMRVVGELELAKLQLPESERIDPFSREQVAQLGHTVVPAAGKGLGNKDVVVRQISLEALEAAAQALIRQVKDPKEELADYAKSVKDEQSELKPLVEALNGQAAALAKVLEDASEANRIQAARVLEMLGHARIRLLRRQESVPTMPTGSSDAGASFRLASTHVLALAEDEPKLPGGFEEGLFKVKKDLARALQDRNWRVRLMAINALETMEGKAATEADAIIRALNDPDLFVRWASARTLGRMAPAAAKDAVPALARRLSDADFNVKLAATNALERYGPLAKDAVSELSVTLGRGDSEMRIAVIHALEAIGTESKPAIPALTSALANPDPRVRRAAAEALGRFGAAAKESGSALQKALEDPDSEVRKAAADALLAIQ